MLLKPYSIEELCIAWCNRIFLRCRTHRSKSFEALATLSSQTLAEQLEAYAIHVLELATSLTEFQAMLSLKPSESTSTAASKTKGRISKWITDEHPNSSVESKLARGYFAVTLGEPDSQSIEDYLERQSEHHGYHERARPPVFVKSFDYSGETRHKVLATDHACTLLRYHAVLATWRRHGVFVEETARCVAERWRELDSRFLIDKVSFVPDHVHIALTLHPAQSPTVALLQLMNAAQELMWERFSHVVIKSSVERLWQPSAYLGSFGELRGSAIKAYMKRWENREE